MRPPPWLNDPTSLVIIDWSWWLNRAMHGPSGPEGMLPLVVGWLCQLLAYEPAHLAIALDSPGETWRHAKRHPTDPAWRYKADRPPKPPSFAYSSSTATRIAELHGIPCLWADAYEADDVIATLCARARDAGYRVWIATADKDIHELVEEDARSGLIVGTWNPFEGDLWTWRGPAAVREEYGVEPSQISDWLAIAGDKSDGVPGIGNDIGPTKAAAILAEHGTLAAALEAPVWSSTKTAEIEAEIKSLGKALAAKAKTQRGAVPSGTDWAAGQSEWAEIKVKREGLMLAKRVAGWHLTLKANAALALFSRELTALDCDAPFDAPWEDLPLGGYQVEELRNLYSKLGYARKAAEVPRREKRAPWRIPWTMDGGAPAPRRIDGDEAGRDERRGGEAVGHRRQALSPVLDVEPRVADEDSPPRAPVEQADAAQVGRVVGEPVGAPAAREQVRRTRESGVPALSPGAEDVPASRSPGDHPILTAPVTPPTDWADVEARLARRMVERAITSLGKKYAIEDLEGRKKFPRITAELRAELLAKLRGERAA